jgi:hypothetical protein
MELVKLHSKSQGRGLEPRFLGDRAMPPTHSMEDDTAQQGGVALPPPPPYRCHPRR